MQSEGDQLLVTGATGLVGRRLVDALLARGSRVRVLSRSARSGRPGVEARTWDGVDPGEEALRGVNAVVHLSGEPLFGGLPTASRLERVRASRVDSTRRLVERIAELPAEARPRCLVCASAVGIYGARGDERLDEDVALGTGFLAELCRDWEREAARARELSVRVVSLRIGVVLARDGGALALMRVPFSLGLGGRLGDGRQYFPWIHLDDLVAAILFGLDHDQLEGPINGVAPEAVRNADLTRTLARVLHRPAFLPVPAFAVRALMGELAGELLESRRVVPARLEAAGFRWSYPALDAALEAELGRD
ncbi:MAG: TIGR01777 family oxidoreductase [Myxococcales bacterium]|nr:TIGR01777 family oxidoreductase [Myxococcales bacterium]